MIDGNNNNFVPFRCWLQICFKKFYTKCQINNITTARQNIKRRRMIINLFFFIFIIINLNKNKCINNSLHSLFFVLLSLILSYISWSCSPFYLVIHTSSVSSLSLATASPHNYQHHNPWSLFLESLKSIRFIGLTI